VAGRARQNPAAKPGALARTARPAGNGRTAERGRPCGGGVGREGRGMAKTGLFPRRVQRNSGNREADRARRNPRRDGVAGGAGNPFFRRLRAQARRLRKKKFGREAADNSGAAACGVGRESWRLTGVVGGVSWRLAGGVGRGSWRLTGAAARGYDAAGKAPPCQWGRPAK
jgi:hypothetical protein